MNKEVIGDTAIAIIIYPELVKMGEDIGKLYTDFGLPVDMALSELDKKGNFTREHKLAIIDGTCRWLIQHKRNSGATEKAIERQRKANRAMLESFYKTGETGVY